jgi:outer membrane protein assembly factor BamB
MLLLSMIGWLSIIGSAGADDWPQVFGPQRDGVWRETGIVDAIPAEGLPVVWRAEIAGGYSGPAVANGRVVVTDFLRASGDATNDPSVRNELAGEERIQCFDAKSGELIWRQSAPCEYKISYPAGPRATPTIDGDRVYTLGAEGRLSCLTLERGEIIWQLELAKEFQAPTPMWGFCGHPLVDGDRLICLVGGEGTAVVAFNKMTGSEIWRSLSAPDAGYSAPMMIQTASGPQLVVWHPESLHGLDPSTGQQIWSVPLKPDYGMSIMMPVQVGDYLFASGIGSVAALVKLTEQGREAEVVWRGEKDTAVYSGNSTPLIVDGVIYGSDCQIGEMLAVDLFSGERLWRTFKPTTGGTRRASHGTAFLVRHEDRFWILSETGDLILANLSREGYDELGRFAAIEPTGETFGRSVVWSYPAFAQKCVFIRNDRELVCINLAKD